MAREITISRDEAELLVDVLEHNYKTGRFYPAGVGADLAAKLRDKFGMSEQPTVGSAPFELIVSGEHMKQKLQFQYYYKTNGCRAKTAQDADCTCWHDEGTGPYKDQRHDDKTPLVEWRIKTAGR